MGTRFLIALLLSLMTFIVPASALVVELDDVAPDRIERQRAFAREAFLPTVTPEADALAEQLAGKGLTAGAPILVRIFKAESELEVWMRKGTTYVLQGTYPVCHWTGTLGPKMREGDKQSPEGFYTVGRRQVRHLGRWRNAFNIGYPNLHDKRLDRTGSYILVHGGCSSVGCFAMTHPAQQVIYRLAAAALRNRQSNFQVHVFPFRMTEANMAAHAENPWMDFWRDLKVGYDAFEATRLPPRIGICGQRYVVGKAAPGVRNDGPLRRVVPGKASAAGFDTSRCGVPVIEPAQPSATVSGPGEGPDAGGTHFTPSSARTVARVERREPAGPTPPFRAERTDYGWVERTPHANEVRTRRPANAKAKAESQAAERDRLREKRRAHREALKSSYLRTLIGVSQ